MPFNINNFTLSGSMIQDTGLGGIVTDGLVLHLDAGQKHSYPMGGTTWYDLSGNGNNFTIYNSPSHNGTNFTFDGVNDYMRSTSTINLSSTNVVTVELGFRVPSVSTGVMTFEFTPDWNTNTGAFGAYTNSNGDVPTPPTTDNDIHTNSAAGVVDFNVTDITSNSIYDFIFESGVGATLYYNNSLATKIRNDNVSSFAGFANNYLYIGSRGGTGAFGVYYLYFLRLYNRKLNTSEIQQNYNATKGRFGL